jgi:phosphatidylglycerophosphate synthase
MPTSLIKAIPNVLSAGRLALAVAFPFLPIDWRLPAMIVGGLSDWIDGLIARRYKAITAAGALLDAIADKVFTLSVLLTIIIDGAHQVHWWQGLLILTRDLTVGAIALYAVAIRRFDAFRHMRPRLPGKLTTTFVFLWLVTVLAAAPPAWQWTLFVLAAAASVLAGLDYLLQFLQRYEEVRVSGP